MVYQDYAVGCWIDQFQDILCGKCDGNADNLTAAPVRFHMHDRLCSADTPSCISSHHYYRRTRRLCPATHPPNRTCGRAHSTMHNGLAEIEKESIYTQTITRSNSNHVERKVKTTTRN